MPDNPVAQASQTAYDILYGPLHIKWSGVLIVFVFDYFNIRLGAEYSPTLFSSRWLSDINIPQCLLSFKHKGQEVRLSPDS